MKIIKRTPATENRGETITVELKKGEHLRVVQEDGHYSLGSPLHTIVPASVLQYASKANWCAAEQKWVVEDVFKLTDGKMVCVLDEGEMGD